MGNGGRQYKTCLTISADTGGSQGIAPPPPRPAWARAASRSLNSPAVPAHPLFLPNLLPGPEESAEQGGS